MKRLIFKSHSVKEKGWTVISLESKPNQETLEQLKIFAEKRNGDFIDKKEYMSLFIKRVITEQHLQILFKELGIEIFSTNYQEKNATQKNNQEYINFGKYKGLAYEDLDVKYLTWLKINHHDLKVRERANKHYLKKISSDGIIFDF